ncbi:MAG: cryptochrome/photolyase family protein [Candidatus Sericytochromatia bacterium]|nr:cryptochrome/photolyase family protein [Candidatus Sericytochromatia bacterium]
MSAFLDALNALAAPPQGRHWLFVPDDQLTDACGPLSRGNPRETGIVLLESRWKARLRPYHRQRLALQWANQRHFALEQAERGVAVRYIWADVPYRQVLGDVALELGPLTMMEAAERELRADLAPLVSSGAIRVVRHEGWLTSTAQFQAACPSPPYKMDSFYRYVRQQTGWLMQEGQPLGGRLSFDVDNRLPWKGNPPAPLPPRFPGDAIKAEVLALVERDFPDHPGQLDPSALPATRADAEALWQFARQECLPHFGPYEDAMSVHSAGLFHTRISALLNMHRLLPVRVVQDVAEDEHLPLQSREGFVRQILGWREFVRHVHARSDGFRELADVQAEPGDAGWGRWRARRWAAVALPEGLDGGAAPTPPGQTHPLPAAFWGTPSGLACLDRVVQEVWESAYGHHITRLMVLANLATLLDLAPREVADWFWVAYADAWDWVVEPNVLGMGLFALGPHMTTKPYVAGAPYLARMSDYCGSCAFDPKRDCPLTRLYWAYLDRHQARLTASARLGPVLGTVRRRTPDEVQRDQAVFEALRAALDAGEAFRPAARHGQLPLLAPDHAGR